MYILGDIGNTDTKLFLVSTKNKIIKKVPSPSLTTSCGLGSPNTTCNRSFNLTPSNSPLLIAPKPQLIPLVLP